LYISEHAPNLDEGSGASSGMRCWRSYFHLSLLTHGSDSSCLQNNSKAQSTPEVTVGNTHSMLTTKDIPEDLNLWHSSASEIKIKPNGCTCVQVCVQMRGWYKNKTMFTPNCKLHAYKVVSKLLPHHKDLLAKVKTSCLSQD
jgi:hypothetical protein